MSEVMERSNIALHGITTVAGRYVIGDQPEVRPGVNLFACRLRMISTDHLRVTAPVIPELGEAVTATLAPFGTASGRVRRQYEDGFEMSIVHDDMERDRLNARISAFSERLWTGPVDRRASERYMPGNPRSVISRPDGWFQPCLIVDYSAHGAAISAAYQPVIGETVTVGHVSGEVVRLFDFGFAIEFFQPQDTETIEKLLEAPDEWRLAIRQSLPRRFAPEFDGND